MDSKELLRLIGLLEKESAARSADHIAFRLTISELNATIRQLQETTGNIGLFVLCVHQTTGTFPQRVVGA